MLDTTNKEYQTIMKQLFDYAKEKVRAEKFELLKPFLEQYYAQASVDELKTRTVRDLFGAVLSHWELMYQRQPGQYLRHVFNPDLKTDGWETSHTVLQFILDDQPFLVDSLRNAINRAGLSVHFVVNLGGMKVVRNTKHYITDILPLDSTENKAIKEAPIYIEIDRQTNPQVLAKLQNELDHVIHDARVVVADWPKMLHEIRLALIEIDQHKPPVNDKELEEIKAFLKWLMDNRFTFLGYRKYDQVGEGEDKALQLVPHSGLGVLRDTPQSKLKRYYTTLPPEALKLALSTKHVLLLAKTNTYSTVHGNRYTDYISVKRFNDQGEIIGEHWFVGLYTSTVYTDSTRIIPVVRLKVKTILQDSGLPENGHSYKTLEHILETLPRDDLFHASYEELAKLAVGILQLQDRHCIRLFSRKDIFNRFISCLVYVPRDDFSIELVNKMQEILLASFHGLDISFTTLFSDSILARIHFTLRLDPKKHHRYHLATIEEKLILVGRSWRNDLHEYFIKHFGEEYGNALMMRYHRAFSVGYQEVFTPEEAIFDVDYIEKLSDKDTLQASLYSSGNTSDHIVHFKLFCSEGSIPLSDAIPILENMGLRVISEHPYKIQFPDGKSVWINDFHMSYPKNTVLNVKEIRDIFQESFKKIWHKSAEDDRLNCLVLSAQLSWREVTILRAYSKYLKQIGFTFSQDYMQETFERNPSVAQLLVQLFYSKFNPEQQTDNITSVLSSVEEKIKQALEMVVNLDDDRILRMFLNLIQATVRVNYFQLDSTHTCKCYVSFKFNPTEVQDLPLPLPKHEIFVYSTRFEGVHLRADKVARGGLRWSDRREDFRQEILGLMKAQQVKNAVIVPAGAKGGFVLKQLPMDSSREETMKEGIACYQNFIRGLLDLTDNYQGNTIVNPPRTICYDEKDPYLVVAADKGTATFSDIANHISSEYQFWLQDAFASGGSTGYDHKKIAITARGAWESVKWHFEELQIDINQPFSVIGIGDMAGDVFGNGMLQSKQIKLLGAFNGTHIFLDPNPDPKISYIERQRLFNLPRSTWEDYNSSLISVGGGVYKKSLKSIKLSPEIKNVLGVKKEQMTPDELIQCMLKAPVDLLWNGGIGTFVKAKNETHTDVGDRMNDHIRVDAHELTCKIVAEGGNLGFTQLGRIEYELSGGRINTDFIDNSGGVDCSDHEVNLKILLNGIMSRGQLTEKKRNQLLAKMTDEVAGLVLHNNYRQVRAISIASQLSFYYLALYSSFMKDNAKQGRIDIKLEYLPDDDVLMSRKASGKGLTRPEIAVLLAYSKIILKSEIIYSDLSKDHYLTKYIRHAFPELIRQRYSAQIEQHTLRPEILATQLSNLLVTDMGITFLYQMVDEVRAQSADIVRAYVIAREIFSLDDYWLAIEGLDISVELQNELTLQVVRLIRRSVRWLLRNSTDSLDIRTVVKYFGPKIKLLSQQLPGLLVGNEKNNFETKRDQWTAADVPQQIAEKIAATHFMHSLLNIIKLSKERHYPLNQVAKTYFLLTDRLHLDEFGEMINQYPLESRWMVQARSAVKGDLDWHQRYLIGSVLKLDKKTSNPVQLVEDWLENNQVALERWETIFSEMKASTAFEYSMLLVAMRELLDLAQRQD